jgi:hypothetical protein
MDICDIMSKVVEMVVILGFSLSHTVIEEFFKQVNI